MSTTNWDDLFENAGAVDDTPAPAGTYLCVIEDASWTKSAKGKAMLKYRSRIAAGPQKSKAFFGNIVISPENPMALQIGLRHLAAVGLTKEVLKSMTDSEQCEHIVGREIMIESELREYKGEMRSDIKDVKPAAGAAEAPTPNTPPAADTPPPASSSTPPPAPFAGS